MAATCLTSVSSDGQLTAASLTFEPQRQLCEVKRVHADVSAIPGCDPLQTFTALSRSPAEQSLRLASRQLADCCESVSQVWIPA